jgi:hypothetical protein
MRGPVTRRGSFGYVGLLAGVCGALLATIGVTCAQTPKPPSNLTVVESRLSQDSSVQVYLVRQDYSDCTNTTVSNVDGPGVDGDISIVRNPDGTTDVKVAMTASPDTTYHVFLKCVRQIGDVTTGDEGTGIDTFSFPTNIVGNVFAFDVYPEGAPLGNKFQSVQVVFK